MAIFDLLSPIRKRLVLCMRRLPALTMRTNHRRLFFPGCSLVSADVQLACKVYTLLHDRYPDIGLWHDCCAMPVARDGSSSVASGDGSAEKKLAAIIQKEGIKEIITACGNCFLQFKKIAASVPDPPAVISAYGILADMVEPVRNRVSYLVHHPCPGRSNREFMDSFFALARTLGLTLENTSPVDHPLFCCQIDTPENRTRRERIKHKKLLTYCAHCARVFQGNIDTTHILQLAVGSDNKMHRTSQVKMFLNYRRFKRLIV